MPISPFTGALSDTSGTREHTAWIGRKEVALKRRTLDCGCPNLGEVYYHLWCDRLACKVHADSLHDCGEFKSKSESGIEEESVEPEAVVDVPDSMVEQASRAIEDAVEAAGFETFTFTNAGGTFTPHQTLRITTPDGEEIYFGPVEPWPWGPAPERVTVTYTPADDAPHVDAALEPDPAETFTPAEVDAFNRLQTLSQECGAYNPMCSGCDGGAVDGFTCMHDCHGFEAQDTDLRAANDRLVAALDEQIPVAPWWRRMLGGGTR